MDKVDGTAVESEEVVHTCHGCGRVIAVGEKIGILPILVANGGLVPVWACPGCGIIQIVKGVEIEQQRILKPKTMVNL